MSETANPNLSGVPETSLVTLQGRAMESFEVALPIPAERPSSRPLGSKRWIHTGRSYDNKT